MTLSEIKSAVAAIFGRTTGDLTIAGQDMFLVAVNQIRREAELLHDFEFSRRLVTLTVDGETGGSLDNAVIKGTATLVKTKTVIDIGLFDDDDNLRPSEWTTVSEGLERQRTNRNYRIPRYPTDQDLRSGSCGPNRFEVSGNTIYKYGKSTTDFPIGLEVYSFSDDWTAGSLNPTAVVTGTLSPNLTGTYSYVGMLNGYPLFYVDGPDYWIYHTGSNWIVAAVITSAVDYFALASTSLSPAGTYTAAGAATGTATVALTSTYQDDWTTYGHQFLVWGTVVFLNHIFKTFVYRQEGNLPPPEKLRDAGLASFIEWDAAKFETNRRHGRV